jgi:hypothetical protein
MKKLLLLIAILAIPVFITACTPKSTTMPSSDADAVATWLTQNGVKMYGAWWCPHCAEQKKIFGDAFQKVNYIECAKPDQSQNETCQAAGIKSYPTWEFSDGSRISKVLTLDQLKEKTGYPAAGTAGPPVSH